MIRSRLLSTIIISALQLFTVHANNAVMELVSFSIEFISSTANPSNSYGINQILLDVTTDHLNNFIANKNKSPWDSLRAATFLKYPKSRFITLNDDDEQAQKQGNGLQILMTQFSGSLSFDNDTNLPTRDDVENVQWEAFIGQAKLDYISILRSQTSSDFLQNVTDIKISWTSSSSNSRLRNILLAVLVGIVSAGAIVGIFFLIQRFRANSSGNVKQKHKHRTRNTKLKSGRNYARNDFHDLELAQTGSLSPTGLEQDFVPTFVDETDSIRLGKSVMTKDTIDVDTGVDMLAWKHRAMRPPEPFEADMSRISKSDVQSAVVSNEEGKNTENISHDMMSSWKKKGTNDPSSAADVPFDADITRISKVSPNKTLVIDIRPMRKGNSSSSSRSKSKKLSSLRENSKAAFKEKDEGHLSKQVLSQHNQIKFQEHARRYAERKNKTTTPGSRHR
jgi:hypothetical protein